MSFSSQVWLITCLRINRLRWAKSYMLLIRPKEILRRILWFLYLIWTGLMIIRRRWRYCRESRRRIRRRRLSQRRLMIRFRSSLIVLLINSIHCLQRRWMVLQSKRLKKMINLSGTSIDPQVPSISLILPLWMISSKSRLLKYAISFSKILKRHLLRTYLLIFTLKPKK